MTNVMPKKKKTKLQKQDLIFYILMMAWPVAQFAVFYMVVNFGSFLLPFQKITVTGGTEWWNMEAMEQALTLTFKDELFSKMRLMSLAVYGYGIFINMPLAVFLSYYIYKKLPVAGFFRVLLYMPSIISAVVMAVMFHKFSGIAIPAYVEAFFGVKIKDLFSSALSTIITLLAYGTIVGCGANMLLYSDSMSGIDTELIEAAHLDGAVGIREFWHITLPGIYPLLSTFIITGIIGIFTADPHLFAFFGADVPYPEIRTYGYWIYVETQKQQQTLYPLISALGLILTLFAVPLTLIVRWALEKFGPSDD